MRFIFVAAFSLLAWVQAATADQARVAQLFDALNMEEIISIMQDEGKLDAVATIEIYAERDIDNEVNSNSNGAPGGEQNPKITKSNSNVSSTISD